jgi:hypothetical protein
VNPALVVALTVAIIGPLGAYLGASRKLSGKIGTSEASDLWAESKNIRDDYRERIDAGNLRQVALETRVANLEGLNAELTRENLSLHALTASYETIIQGLRDDVDALKTENAELKRLVTALHDQLGNGKDA